MISPPEVNEYDSLFAEGPEYATGYRIYELDKEGNRYTIGEHKRCSKEVERDVTYWHSKEVAEEYLGRLPSPRNGCKYEIFKVEALRKESPWPDSYGQVAKELIIL